MVIATTKVWPPIDHSVLEGFQELTDAWSPTLPEPMARRMEDENLVLWHPAITALIAAHGEGNEEQSRMRRLNLLRRECDPDGRVLNADDGEVITFRSSLTRRYP
ncbi:MAG: hypothetical protein H7Z43_04845 [Clostridia bacterium]|nr:hypothetical protein [Deltaproteobacteria bacterium]